ncbi:MAG: pyridoxamine 5'-phosphate oxidase family protein [Micrococcales bacterium]|nr:pyridoxamine 5'-phosphate oxidase family protein [Micrococcales bacterium]MCL2668381.1 pyridoxamine 5'-phosphate oxidase family protein [Micrococcales bacterium]
MKNWVEARVAVVARRQGLRRNQVGIEPDEQSAARILAVARRRMTKVRLCTFITSGPDGPTARVVMPFAPTPDLVVHIATSPASTKARQVAATGEAVLAYSAGMSAAVTAYCHAEALDDPDDHRRWWRPLFAAYWPDGPSKDYTVIACRPHAIEVWSPDEGIGPAPLGLRSGRIVLHEARWRLDSTR